MGRPVRRHSFDELGYGKVLLRLRMIGRFGKVFRLEAMQQSQVSVAIQAVECDQFSRWSLETPRLRAQSF